MPIPFIMPKFDMDQEKATIISWSKKEGDLVKFEETVLTVETEKVAIDVPAPANGILAGIMYKDGDEVPVTKVIAYILKEGETLKDVPGGDVVVPARSETLPVSQTAATPPLASVNATPIAARVAKEEGIDLSKVPAAGERIRREDVERFIADQKSIGRLSVPATPAARRVARESGIALEAVTGSGPRGRVQSSDVLVAVKTASAPSGNGREAEVVPLTSIRRTIAERMQHNQAALSILLSATQRPQLYDAAGMTRTSGIGRHLGSA